MELYPYQVVGRDFLAHREVACLWDDPGLGKSFQTLSALKEIGAKNTVILCPASVRMVWQSECEKLNIDSHVVISKGNVGSGVNIMSYDAMVRTLHSEVMASKFDLLVNDEAHFLKNQKSSRTQRVFGEKLDRKDCISHVCSNVWSLTGTPMPNNPSELYPVLRAKFPDAIEHRDGKPMSYWQFVMRYCQTKDNGFGIQITGGHKKNIGELRDKLRGRVIRRRKDEVLKDLPPIRYEKLPVKANLSALPKNELKLVEECLNAPEPLQELKTMGTHVAQLRRITGMSKAKPVAEWALECPYNKVVLFAHHTQVIHELSDRLPNSVYIDGSCNEDQRRNAVDAFQNGDARFFIGQTMAAGTGITLTAANVLVFVEADWVPANLRQAADRIHRIGQLDSCLILFATVPNSIDDDIMGTVKRKLETYKDLGF